MRYDPHRYYIAPALARAEIWRTAAGAGLTIVAGFALYQFAFALVSTAIGPAATQALADATTFDRGSPAAALYSLFTFGFFTIGLAMVLNSLHERRLSTLFGPWATVASDFLRSSMSVGLLLLALAIVLPQDTELVRNIALSRGDWLVLLPVSLTALMVQAGTEELFFRGYLQQQIAARFPRLPLWLILPSALFGLAHMVPGSAGANAPMFALWALAFGLAAADLTARTGSIGAALGFHMANNAVAVLLIALQGPGSGLALYHLPMELDDARLGAMLLPEIATTFCCWLVARLALKV
jgi:membrane protease YdiL (CAAX protease family)